jgi:hypothetical protein
MSKTIAEPDPINLIELQERLSVVERELAEIRNRNRRVESDKAWETSRVRLLSITGITYVTSRPFVDALVPTTGFFLSTLSISFLRARLGKYQSQ